MSAYNGKYVLMYKGNSILKVTFSNGAVRVIVSCCGGNYRIFPVIDMTTA